MALTNIKCTDGFELGAYEAMPAGDAKGAVVVIQEVLVSTRTSAQWWMITQQRAFMPSHRPSLTALNTMCSWIIQKLA